MDDGLTPSQRANAAVTAVERRFNQITSALRGKGIPFAVIGNQATSLWIATVDDGAVRSARDTEILVERSYLEAAAKCAVSIGLIPDKQRTVPTFVDSERPQSRNVIRYFFANEKASEEDALPAPGLTSLQFLATQRVLPLDLHITWQLTRYRMDDRVDIIDMMGVNLVRQSLAERLPDALRQRLNEMFDAFKKEREGFAY